jgi:hypothetical protein
MREERLRILEMLASGKITAQEAAELLEALGRSEERERREDRQGGGMPRWFRVRVTDTRSGRRKTDINIPINFGWGLRFVDRFMGRSSRKAVHKAWHAFQQGERGERGTLVDVVDERTGERVEIILE